jgi:centromere/kinetochore protein ZW10
VLPKDDVNRCTAAVRSLEHLFVVFNLLNLHLLGTVVVDDPDCTVNFSHSSTGDQTLMSIFGRLHSKSVLEAIVSECLSASLPSSRSELSAYSSSVIVCVENLNQRLVEIGFVAVDDRTVPDYIGGIEMLFANKRCQEILETARTLMLSDIHNIVQVSEDKQALTLNLPPVDSGVTRASKKSKPPVDSICEVKLDPVFSFPPCHISVATQKLVEMAYNVLREGMSMTNDEKLSSPSSTPESSLFYSVRNMFEMFATIVPVYHRDHLAKFPQMAAIHHNDCMYVAHHLTLMGHQYRSCLPELPCAASATFIDLVPVLRRSGTRCFLDQMSAQKTQIVQTLNAARGFAGLSNEANLNIAEHTMAQVLHQLRHLVNVWRDILPAHIYAKAIGTLLNSTIVELISSIIALDDITEDDAEMLSQLLNNFTESAQVDIVTPMADCCPSVPLVKLVPSWGRMEEVKFMLRARLQEIIDRWTDGPLAAEMSTTEVKQMIRVLFANTEKRSAALAAVK